VKIDSVPWDINHVNLVITKHFSRIYLSKWGWDYHLLREAIKDAYKIEKLGKVKYEIYIQKSGFKKIITAYYGDNNLLICISGSKGGSRK
jgi:hypothetical protein